MQSRRRHGQGAPGKSSERSTAGPATDEPAGYAERVRRLSLLLAVVLTAVVGVVGAIYLTQPGPPQTPRRALGAIPAAGAATTTTNTTTTGQPAPPAPTLPAVAPVSGPLAPSAPLTLSIPAIDVHSSVIPLGLAPDGTIQVPTSYHVSGWYDLGPTPGQIGPAVIIGHVDSSQGPGVFYKLGTMQPGQLIDVTLADQATAHFRVDAIETYLKTQFPTQKIYGHINYAGLRLVTCGGKFDRATHSYLSNIVVYATLVGV